MSGRTLLRFPNPHARDRAVTILAAGKEDRLRCARLLQARFAVFTGQPPAGATGVFVELTRVLDAIGREREATPARREVPPNAYRYANRRRAGR